MLVTPRALVAGIALAAAATAIAGCAATSSTAPAPAPKPATSPAPAPSPTSTKADPLAEDGTAAVVSGCGYRLVVNGGDAHFTVDLWGTSVQSGERDDTVFFQVDDLVVQVVNVTRAQIGASATGKSGLALLRAHEAWESAYIARQLGVTAEPKDIAVLRDKDGKSGTTPSQLHGNVLTWWLPLPDRRDGGASIHRSWGFVTMELGGRVVGLSALAERGLEPFDVVTRLASWMATFKPSATRLSVPDVSADIRAKSAATTDCPPVSSAGILGVDRRLRFDGIPRETWERLIRVAEKAGGVERQTIDGRLRYRNHVCRFELTYPEEGWTDFEVQDLSETGCSANIATPLLEDKDTKEKITNAVLLTVTRASAAFGAAQLHAGMVDGVKGKGARVETVKKPLFDGGLDVSYTADTRGTFFMGEIVTVRRGDMLYNLHFNSTRGTSAEGRKHLAKILATLKLDVP